MSEGTEPDPGGLVPTGERSLVHSPGGLAGRGLALATTLGAGPLPKTTPGEVRCLRGHADCVVAVAISADGTRAVSGSWDRTARIWSLATGEEVLRLQGHDDRITAVAFSAGAHQVLTGSWDGTARLWDGGTGRELGRFGEPGAGMVQCVELSPDGRHAAWGGADGCLTLRDLTTGEERQVAACPGGIVRCLRFSPDGRQLLSGSGQPALGGEGPQRGALCLWDSRSGERLWGWAGATEPVLSLAVSHAGGRVLCVTGWPSRGRLNVTRTWDIETGTEVSRHEAHRQTVFSGLFLSDLHRGLLAGRDRLLRVWDFEKEEEMHRFAGHTDTVYSVAVAADGKLAISGSGDRTVRLWRLPDLGAAG